MSRTTEKKNSENDCFKEKEKAPDGWPERELAELLHSYPEPGEDDLRELKKSVCCLSPQQDPAEIPRDLIGHYPLYQSGVVVHIFQSV